jgi:hypothetical protein
MLAELQSRKMPTIYISHVWIQNETEARESAQKFGAYYYGNWNKGVPLDRVHYQYDMPGIVGHMTGEGCQIVAKQILPLVEQVLSEK